MTRWIVWKNQICPCCIPAHCIASIFCLLPAKNECKLFYPKAGLWRQMSCFVSQHWRNLSVIKVWKQPTMGAVKYLSLSSVGIMSQGEGIHMQKIVSHYIYYREFKNLCFICHSQQPLNPCIDIAFQQRLLELKKVHITSLSQLFNI